MPIVTIKMQLKPFGKVFLNVPTHATTTTHKTRVTLTPLGVQTLYDTGQATSFITRGVLVCSKQTGIGSPMIRANRLASIRFGNQRPDLLQRSVTPVSKAETQHLVRRSRDDNPVPKGQVSCEGISHRVPEPALLEREPESRQVALRVLPFSS